MQGHGGTLVTQHLSAAGWAYLGPGFPQGAAASCRLGGGVCLQRGRQGMPLTRWDAEGMQTFCSTWQRMILLDALLEVMNDNWEKVI